MTNDDRLTDLIVCWEEFYRRGNELAPEELCRHCPKLAEAAAKKIAALKRFVSLNKGLQGVGADPIEANQLGKRPRPTNVAPILFRLKAEPIPGCRLIRKLGQGAFGEVYSAEWNGMLVAVKFFHGSLDLPDDRKRVEMELEGLDRIKKVNDDSILEVYNTLVEENILILITELADTTLGKHFGMLRASCSNFDLCAKALQLLRGPAQALDHLQELGLSHSDIKPENLLLVSDQCKIGDFGTVKFFGGPCPPDGKLVFSSHPGDRGGDSKPVVCPSYQEVPWRRAFDQGATLFTIAGAVTLRYAPPEAFAGKRSRSFDQYSLAITFCELVTGAIPFPGEGEAQRKARREGKPDLRFLPKQIRRAVARALAARPQDRYPCCTDFIKAVQKALGPRPPSDPQPRTSAGEQEAKTVLRPTGVLVYCLIPLLVLVGWISFLHQSFLQWLGRRWSKAVGGDAVALLLVFLIVLSTACPLILSYWTDRTKPLLGPAVPEEKKEEGAPRPVFDFGGLRPEKKQ
jgi:serine/threonine protein kinase